MRQKSTKPKLVRLASINVQIGLSLIETSAAYSGNIRPYKGSVLTSLSLIFEALSGVFGELAKNQRSANESEKCEHGCFTEKIQIRNILFSAKRYLEKCSTLLASENDVIPPFTAMCARAQTLAFEIQKDEKSRPNIVKS